MKAVIWTKYGPPALLELKEVSKPIPKANEVLVKIHAATVTPGDCEIRRFDIHPLFWLPLRLYMGLFKPKRPILGMEFSGTIEATGSQVDRFRVGDEVMAGTGLKFGSYAEYNCHNTKFMALKPTNMSFAEAATLPIGAINALHYLRLANIQNGDKILIIGAAGCFGSYAVQIAKNMGAEVTAVDSTDKIEALKSWGVDQTVDFKKEDFRTHGITYDVIFDIAGKDSVIKNMRVLKKGGAYILATPWVKQVLQGRWAARTTGKKFFITLAKDDPNDLTYLKDLVEKGKLTALVGKSYPLEQMVEAHEHVENGEKIGHVTISVHS